MPAMRSKLPTLSLLNNLSQSVIGSDGYPKERQISRSILLDISPDREDLLSNNSIEDIREKLKLCVHSSQSHWLHCTNGRHDTKPAHEDATTCNPLLNRLHDNENTTEDHEVASCHRTLSNSSTDFSGTVVFESSFKDMVDAPKAIWSSRSLSTQEKLISPRPLGPTHTLVVSRRHQDNRHPDANSSLEDPLELPINDLLFILNVPNLRTSRKNGRLTSVLPRRSYKEMPRVALHVPSLDTFPEVVAYLHTKDKDALFRQLIPEWIWNVIHPFTSTSSLGLQTSVLRPLEDATIRVCNEDIELSGSQCLSFLGLGLGLHAASIAKGSVKRLYRPISSILALGHHPNSAKSARLTGIVAATSPDNSPKLQNDQRRKAVSILAKEIVEAHAPIDPEPGKTNTDLKMSSATTHSSDHDFEVNILQLTADRLDALAANFTYLGYFERTLWLELDIYRGVIAEALELPPQ